MRYTHLLVFLLLFYSSYSLSTKCELTRNAPCLAKAAVFEDDHTPWSTKHLLTEAKLQSLEYLDELNYHHYKYGFSRLENLQETFLVKKCLELTKTKGIVCEWVYFVQLFFDQDFSVTKVGSIEELSVQYIFYWCYLINQRHFYGFSKHSETSRIYQARLNHLCPDP